MMRSNKLGYNAPIIVKDKKYYTYEDPEYSITNIPISEEDLLRMSEAVEMLKQFKGFSHFNSLRDVVQKLENHVYAATHHTNPVIIFDRNDRLKGLEYLDTIYKAIVNKKALNVTYRSFKASNEETFIYHAWWLKEFKNRWFAVGVRRSGSPPYILHLALDRIVSVALATDEIYLENTEVQPEEFYKHAIGATVSFLQQPRLVKIWVSPLHAPYVETKPLHHSQETLFRKEDGSIVIAIKVVLNFELEKEILGFGQGVKVLTPASLKAQIRNNIANALRHYEDKRGIQ
jgi:predicted DNA-binding transcriptional regulator YafY